MGEQIGKVEIREEYKRLLNNVGSYELKGSYIIKEETCTSDGIRIITDAEIVSFSIVPINKAKPEKPIRKAKPDDEADCL